MNRTIQVSCLSTAGAVVNSGWWRIALSHHSGRMKKKP